MSIGAGGIVRASLLLSLALGTSGAMAQTFPGGTWTDPPARLPAPAAPPSAAASPAAVTPAPVQPPAAVPKAIAEKAVGASPAASKPDRSARSVARQPAAPVRKPTREAMSTRAVTPSREARRTRPQVVAEAPRLRSAPRMRTAEHREAVRPTPRRMVGRPFAPRVVAAQSYPYGPLPVGRVMGPVDGERNPIFEEGDDRTRRIAAAQAAGYLVVRARSVQFPDGRTLRSYRPYDDDDGLD